MDLRARLAHIENHPLHRLMGVERIDSGGGRSRIEIAIGPGAVNPRGAFHGGVAYTLCDMACYAALLSQLGAGEDAATSDIQVSLLRSARQGERVVVTGEVLKRGRTLAFMQARIDKDGELIARASVTKAILRGPAG